MQAKERAALYKNTGDAIMKIVKTDPGVRGDTAQGGTKPATLETGAVVQVPLFIEEGDVLKVDRREDKYLTRVTS